MLTLFHSHFNTTSYQQYVREHRNAKTLGYHDRGHTYQMAQKNR